MPEPFRYRDRWQTSVRSASSDAFAVKDAGSYSRYLTDLEERDIDLEEWLVRNVAGTGWTNATLTAPWVNYGGTWNVAQYRKIGDEVQVRGLVAGGASGQVVTTLPVGFRPPAGLIFATSVDVGGGNVFARLDAVASGVIVAYCAAGAAAYLSINCSFSTEP